MSQKKQYWLNKSNLSVSIKPNYKSYTFSLVFPGEVELVLSWRLAVWVALALLWWICATTMATSCTTLYTHLLPCWLFCPFCYFQRANESPCPRHWLTGSNTGVRRWAGKGGTTFLCLPHQIQRPSLLCRHTCTCSPQPFPRLSPCLCGRGWEGAHGTSLLNLPSCNHS